MRKEAQVKNEEPISRNIKACGPFKGSSIVGLMKDFESQIFKLIQTCPVPNIFKLPTLKSYDSSTNSMDHWQQFGNIISLQNVPDGIICRAFVTILKGAVRMWCNSLPPNSIQSS